MKHFSPGKYVTILKERFFNGIGFPFKDLLSETMIQRALQKEGISYRKRLYTPTITLWMWLCQALDKDKSCKDVVSYVVSCLSAAGEPTPSTDTGAYCKARKRLKERFLVFLLRHTGKHLLQESQLQWHGRDVFIVDGSTVTAADTEANQKQYPQPTSQADGCGFPMVNMVAIFCLATGALVEIALSALSTHEINLFRSLCQRLQPGAIVLGDRLYGTYADICLLKARGVDCVFRMHWRRKTDFRRGKILGCYDHIIEWTKPVTRSQGLTQSRYKRLPKSIKLREVRYLVEIKGFRPKEITLVTTLLDAEIYSKQALAQLYELRWSVETDLRHLKTTMGMEHLPCKSPQMVRKEIYIHLLAYNLVRILMFQADAAHQSETHRPMCSLSFQNTIRHLINFGNELAHASNKTARQYIYKMLLYSVFKEQLPIRPGRFEPRLKKRRPKNYKYLKRSRTVERQKLIA